MVTQSDQIRGCHREMINELNELRQDVSFREFVGYEMAVNHFEQRFRRFLNESKLNTTIQHRKVRNDIQKQP